RVGQATAGIRLESNTVFLQRVNAAEGVEQCEIRLAATVVRIEETVPNFQSLNIRRKSGSRQLGREHSVPRRVSDMEGLGHGAEVRCNSTGHRSGYRKCRFDFRLLQAEQLCAGCRSAEDPECPICVPAADSCGLDGQDQSRCYLKAGDVGFED